MARLTKLKVTCSNRAILAKLDVLGKEHDKLLTAAKDEITKGNMEHKQSVHPGFVIAFDNIDIQLQRKNMTIAAQNRNLHWVNHKMVINRVSGSEFPGNGPKCDLQRVPNLKFVPSIEDHQQQRFNYMVLVSRILVSYFDAFEFLKMTCLWHLPHKYQTEMSRKSTKVSYIYYHMYHII